MIKRKDYEHIKHTMGQKSAKEFVKAIGLESLVIQDGVLMKRQELMFRKKD